MPLDVVSFKHISQIPCLSQPMKTLRLHPNLFIDADRWRPLPEPLVSTVDDLGADTLVIEEDAGFP